MTFELTGRHYHTQVVNGELILGNWDHRPLMNRFNAIKIDPGDTLLDAGCRDGMFSAYFARRGAVVTAIDIDDTDIRRKVQGEHGFEFIRMNILELPEVDRKWDLVFCSDVLCHMRDPLGGLLAIRGVCQKKAYFVTDGHKSLGKSCIMHPDGRTDREMRYPFLWSPDFFYQMLEWAGFSNIRRLNEMELTGHSFANRTVYLFGADVGAERLRDVSDILEWKRYKNELP